MTHALYEYSCRIYRNLSDVFIFVMNNKESYNTRQQFYIHELYVLQYKVLHPISQNKEYIYGGSFRSLSIRFFHKNPISLMSKTKTCFWSSHCWSPTPCCWSRWCSGSPSGCCTTKWLSPFDSPWKIGLITCIIPL